MHSKNRIHTMHRISKKDELEKLSNPLISNSFPTKSNQQSPKQTDQTVILIPNSTDSLCSIPQEYENRTVHFHFMQLLCMFLFLVLPKIYLLSNLDLFLSVRTHHCKTDIASQIIFYRYFLKIFSITANSPRAKFSQFSQFPNTNYSL